MKKDKIEEEGEEGEEIEEEEESEKKESNEVQLLETVKEAGIGFKVPTGEVFEVGELNRGLIQWMKWMTERIYEIKESVA